MFTSITLLYAADFIKYFQIEDQKFQDCGKENISGLSVGHVMQEKSNSDEDTMSLMDLACLGNLGLDTINSFRN